MKDRPLLILLSCTRNYSWCTRAFLEVNTKWADYVLIVDQMSTDGTREMCAEYSNVILIDNPDLSYDEGVRNKMLIDRAREIPGDKILIDLAIDEVMPANFQDTADWNRILNSKPGDAFELFWANLLPDKVNYKVDAMEKPWMFRIIHDDGITPYEPVGKIHISTLPCPSDGRWFGVHDFPILHFGNGYYDDWNFYKLKFYQMVDIVTRRSNSIVSLLRTYSCWIKTETPIIKKVNKEWLDYGFDVYSLVDNTSTPIIAEYMRDLINKYGVNKFAGLDIWDDKICQVLGVKNPNKWYHRLLHHYINTTRRCNNSIVIRAIDKILKIILK